MCRWTKAVLGVLACNDKFFSMSLKRGRPVGARRRFINQKVAATMRPATMRLADPGSLTAPNTTRKSLEKRPRFGVVLGVLRKAEKITSRIGLGKRWASLSPEGRGEQARFLKPGSCFFCFPKLSCGHQGCMSNSLFSLKLQETEKGSCCGQIVCVPLHFDHQANSLIDLAGLSSFERARTSPPAWSRKKRIVSFETTVKACSQPQPFRLLIGCRVAMMSFSGPRFPPVPHLLTLRPVPGR